MQIDKMPGKPVQPNQEPLLIKYFFLNISLSRGGFRGGAKRATPKKLKKRRGDGKRGEMALQREKLANM